MHIDTDGKFAYAIADLPEIVSLGRSYIYEEIRNGSLRTVKAGRRTLVLSEDLKRWVNSLPNREIPVLPTPPKNR